VNVEPGSVFNLRGRQCTAREIEQFGVPPAPDLPPDFEARSAKQKERQLAVLSAAQTFDGWHEPRRARFSSERGAITAWLADGGDAALRRAGMGVSARRALEAFRRVRAGQWVDTRGRPSMNWADFSPDAWAHFLSLFLDPRRRSAKLCHDVTAAEAAREGWRWPHYDRVRLRLGREVSQSATDYHRLGQKRWERVHAPRMRRDYSMPANESWVGDHHEFDFVCLHAGKTLRPWLTAWQDLRSRMLVGWTIAPAPDSDTILAALRAGVQEHGAPLHIIIDNGRDYRARGVAGGKVFRQTLDEQRVGGVCGALGIGAHFCRPFEPQSKPVERSFGTVCARFSKLFEAYVGGSPDRRPEHIYRDLRAGDVECKTLEEIRVLFGRWVRDVYHLTEHSGDGMDGRCPLDVFEATAIAKRTATADALDLLLMRTESVKVTRHGVRYSAIDYGMHTPALQALHGQRVLLRIDPLDAGHVLVCDLQGRVLCDAPANDNRVVGFDRLAIKRGLARQRAAKRLVKAARPALLDAHKGAVEHILAAQAEHIAQRRATGTDDASATGAVPRPLAPIAGAAELAAGFERAKPRSSSRPMADYPAVELLEMSDLRLPERRSEPAPFDWADLDDYFARPDPEGAA